MTTVSSDSPVYAPAPRSATDGGTREGQPAAAARPSADEVSTRFLQLLIPAAASVASTFGPQIGTAVGGLLGGSSGATTGGQIGSTVGGLLGSLGGGLNLGGLFAGRSLLPADALEDLLSDGAGKVPAAGIDFTGQLVQQCTLDCLGTLTPDLASMLQDLYPQMQPAAGDAAPGRTGSSPSSASGRASRRSSPSRWPPTCPRSCRR